MDLRVLFVGNSHTYLHKMPQMIAALAAAKDRGFSLFPTVCAQKRAGLEQHWNNGVCLEKLAEKKWDYVVLQDRSGGPLEDRASFDKHAGLLVEAVKQKGAKPLFYMTWANRSRPGDQEILADAYASAAKRLGAGLVPAGLVWQAVLNEHPDLDLHHPDGRHAGAAGAYLTACVFYAALFGASPVGLPARFFIQGKLRVDLDPHTARILQESACTMLPEQFMGDGS